MEMAVTALAKDISAYEDMREELERMHRGKWAVFHAGEFVGVYVEFEDAAAEAVDRFDYGPYLIRQIGVEEIRISPTLTFRPSHARSASRI